MQLTGNPPSDRDFRETARPSGVLYRFCSACAWSKKTVNPGRRQRPIICFTADGKANPGTEPDLLLIFPVATGNGARRQPAISRTGLRVADEKSLGYWRDRLKQAGGHTGDVTQVDGRLTLAVRGQRRPAPGAGR